MKSNRSLAFLVWNLFVLILFSFLGVFSDNYISDDSIIYSSTIINSVINHSTVDNSYIENSVLLYTSAYNTTLKNLTARFADIQEDLLIDGLIDYCNYTYAGPFDLNLIYKCVLPTSVGKITFSDSDATVHPGQYLVVYFDKEAYLKNVTLEINFPSPLIASMHDDGSGCDDVANDGIYCYAFTVPSVSGSFIARVNFTDVYGNELNTMKTLTVDDSVPAISNLPDGNKYNQQLIELTFDTSESAECRLDENSVPFDQMKYVMQGELHHQYIYNAQNGDITLYYACKDLADNIATGSFTIHVDYTKPIIENAIQNYYIFDTTIFGAYYYDLHPNPKAELWIDQTKFQHYNSSLTMNFDNNYNDLSLYHHSISLTGNEAYVTGISGNAFSFDGATYLSVSSSSLFDVSSNGFFISLWMKTSNDGTLISRANYYKLYVSSGNLIFEYNDGTLHQVNAGAINDNQWHHVAVVFNPTNKQIDLYVDSRLKGSTSYGSEISSANDLWIGYDGTNYYSGLIDELTIGQASGRIFLQKAFNIFFVVDTTLFADGLHTFTVKAYDDYGNMNSDPNDYYINNYNENLIITNLVSNAHIKTSPILHFLVPSQTYKLALQTNCGTIASEIYSDSSWDILWNVSGLTATGCYVYAEAYDFEGNLLDTLNVSDIEIDNTPPNVDFTIASIVNSDFVIDPTDDVDTQYYDLYVCNNYLARFLVNEKYYVHVPYYYGNCDVKIVAYDEVGNVNSVTHSTFIDTRAPTTILTYNSTELYPNLILKDNVTFVINANDDNAITSYKLCIDGNCTEQTSNSFTINTMNYLQTQHEIYGCAKDVVNNLGCSKLYVVRFDNLMSKYPIYLYDFINNTYHFGVENYSIHVPYNTYNIKIYLNSTLIFEGLSYRFSFNTLAFSDGTYDLKLFAYDNLGNLLGSISYRVYILNSRLSAPILNLEDRYDNDGIIYLNWTPISGAIGYKIYRAYWNSTFTYLDFTTSTHYYDYVNEGYYKYYVVPVDVAGKDGNKSNIVETEVRLHPVVGKILLDYALLKPGDVLNVKFYAYDSRELNVSIDVFGNNYLLAYVGYTLQGYLYETNITVPSVDGIFTLNLNAKDNFGFTSNYDADLVIDKNIPQPSMNILTLSTRGFKLYNSSVTALPYVFYSVQTSTEDSCLVIESNFAEEFSNVTLSKNAVTYSGTILERPNDDDFALLGNFSKSISLSSGTIFARFYPTENFELNLGVTFTYNSSGLFFCGHVITLSNKWHDLMIKFDSNESVVYVDGVSYSCSGFTLNSVSGTNVLIDYLIVSPGLPKTLQYGNCQDYIYLTTDDGTKTLAALVKDVAGNVNVVYASILLDKSGAKLDVTPPSEPVVKVNKKWVKQGDSIVFTWYNATDFEQELLNLPLSYEVQFYINSTLVDSFITNSTRYIYDGNLSHDSKYHVLVRAINLAGLKSKFVSSENVTADLIPPTKPIVNSTTHTYCVWTNSRMFNATWQSTDDLSGVNSYSYALYLYNLSAYNLSMIYNFVNETSASIPIIVDGKLYFYVVAKDNAGNIGEIASYPICSDLTPPTRPTLLNFYQIHNTTDIYVEWSKSVDYESGEIKYYEVQILNASTIVFDRNYTLGELTEHNYSYSVIISGLPSGYYHARIRAIDVANNPSVWSDEKVTKQDTTPPVFIYTTPSGEVINNKVRITVKTDEVAVCKYSVNGGAYYDFLYTNSTYHETYVQLPAVSSANVSVVCTNEVGLSSSTSISFDISSAGDLANANMSSKILTDPVISDALMNVEVNIKRTTTGLGIANIPRSWFSLKAYSSVYEMNITDFSLIDYGGGKYELTFKAPPYNPYSTANDPNYNLVIAVNDGVNELVNVLTFNVSELRAVMQLTNATSTSYKIAYTKSSNVAYGVAVDDSSVYAASPEQVSGRADDGSFYLFVTVPAFDPSKVESMLYKQKLSEQYDTFGPLPTTENLLNVLAQTSRGRFKDSFTLDSGSYKIKLVNVGYDESGNPIYEVQVIQ